MVIVNESLARRFFPGEDAVGQQLMFGTVSVEVVGVVGDVRQRGPAEIAEPQVYLHAHQNLRSRMSIVARTAGDPTSVIPAIRSAIWNENSNQTLTSVTSFEDILGRAVARPRLLASLFALFGLLGLALGSTGISGVLAYSVSQRRQEIGVRMALGAAPRRVLALILSQGMRLAAAGFLIGVTSAVAISGTLRAVLFNAPTADSATYVQTGAVLLTAALFASWIPARRALAIDPAVALRSD